MTGKRYKYLFGLLLIILLVMMFATSRNTGISCDEVLHYNQSVAVYKYFATNGADTSALNTPVTNLKYYGQSYDNIVTILTRWLGIDDIYGFRNLMSSLAGWLVVLITALFAVWLSGYKQAIIVVILFALSPTFLGHAQNNLKDIPFSLGYIASIYFILRFLSSGRRASLPVIVMLTLSMAFTMSIRAGGLIVICYLFLFTLVHFLVVFINEKTIVIRDIWVKAASITGISVASWIFSIMLWPFALQAPIANVLESYRVMAHFPDTFRQIFEGRVEWSDFMPWYYLPKSMLITIPLIVTSGIVIFIFSFRNILQRGKGLLYLPVIFTVLFPVIFVIYEKSNLYSSWRQFLFLYPPLVLLASAGIARLFERLKSKFIILAATIALIALSIHPFKFMIRNHRYSYIYYNQLVGGTKGAYARYELDYYYISQTQASEWLITYLRDKNITGGVKVKATYPVDWQFRKIPGIETSYFRWEERSIQDWDYAISVNRYISPYQLNNNIWPPKNALHIIYADDVPICAVVERKSKEDLLGYEALREARYRDAIAHFEKVLKENDDDEMIFYNFAAALYKDQQYQKADSVLKIGLNLNPGSDPILMYLGNIARANKRNDEAAGYYRRLIKANRKYFEAYVELAEIEAERDTSEARRILIECLKIYPNYKPAIVLLADTYRKSDPDVARRYDELLKTIN
jgi:tetratricopeptide (TPR) repeat protein